MEFFSKFKSLFEHLRLKLNDSEISGIYWDIRKLYKKSGEVNQKK